MIELQLNLSKIMIITCINKGSLQCIRKTSLLLLQQKDWA